MVRDGRKQVGRQERGDEQQLGSQEQGGKQQGHQEKENQQLDDPSSDRLEKSKTLFQDIREKFEEESRLKDDKILSDVNKQLHGRYFTAHKAIQSGKGDKLTEELEAAQMMEPTAAVGTKYGEAFTGSANEISVVYVLSVGNPGYNESVHATKESCQLRYREIMSQGASFIEMLTYNLRGGNIKPIQSMLEKHSEKLQMLRQGGSFDDLPKPEKKQHEQRPKHWAENIAEDSLDIEPAVARKIAKNKSVTSKKTAEDEDDDEDGEVSGDEDAAPAQGSSRRKRRTTGILRPASTTRNNVDEDADGNANEFNDEDGSNEVAAKQNKKAPTTARGSSRRTTTPSAAPTADEQRFFAKLPANVHAIGTTTSTALAGKIFVISGTFKILITQKRVSDIITKHGGKVGACITGKTSYVVLGEKATAKVRENIEKTNTQTLNEGELFAMISGRQKAVAGAGSSSGSASNPAANDEEVSDEESQPLKKRLRRS
ncbi:hypothetical protein DSL72_002610 [Monilinia vaccinii-corymbosi]|uniref:BRCT domain-containing protein n=1 Tax=Monilinia vaccinii-corymbosi TaxID=61207 RepID=A0A8A3PD57_9HELO|nr:hypothetical protein DSL72_002610 [Monilinia vaccinii-corymbosi]